MAQALAQPLGPLREGLGEGGGVQGLEEAVEGIVAGGAARQAQDPPQQLFAGVAEVLHVVDALSTDQQRADGDDQQIGQLMLPGAFDLGIGRTGQDRNQARRFRH